MPFPPANVYANINDSPNAYFTTDCTIGLSEYQQEKLSIYPNPANDLLTIETNGSGLHTIEIYSLNGQLISISKIDGPTLQLDISTFQKGVYFITVKSRDYVRTEKIIKL